MAEVRPGRAHTELSSMHDNVCSNRWRRKPVDVGESWTMLANVWIMLTMLANADHALADVGESWPNNGHHLLNWVQVQTESGPHRLEFAEIGLGICCHSALPRLTILRVIGTGGPEDGSHCVLWPP